MDEQKKQPTYTELLEENKFLWALNDLNLDSIKKLQEVNELLFIRLNY